MGKIKFPKLDGEKIQIPNIGSGYSPPTSFNNYGFCWVIPKNIFEDSNFIDEDANYSQNIVGFLLFISNSGANLSYKYLL